MGTALLGAPLPGGQSPCCLTLPCAGALFALLWGLRDEPPHGQRAVVPDSALTHGWLQPQHGGSQRSPCLPGASLGPDPWLRRPPPTPPTPGLSSALPDLLSLWGQEGSRQSCGLSWGPSRTTLPPQPSLPRGLDGDSPCPVASVPSRQPSCPPPTPTPQPLATQAAHGPPSARTLTPTTGARSPTWGRGQGDPRSGPPQTCPHRAGMQRPRGPAEARGGTMLPAPAPPGPRPPGPAQHGSWVMNA